MKNAQVCHRSRRAPRLPSAPLVPLKVFIGYADLPAFRRATGSVGEAIRASSRRIDLQPMLWRYEQLASAHWRNRAMHAALAADVVILTSSTPSALDAVVDGWITDFLQAAQGRRTTLVVITSPADAWTITIEQPRRDANALTVTSESVLPQTLVA